MSVDLSFFYLQYKPVMLDFRSLHHCELAQFTSQISYIPIEVVIADVVDFICMYSEVNVANC